MKRVLWLLSCFVTIAVGYRYSKPRRVALGIRQSVFLLPPRVGGSVCYGDAEPVCATNGLEFVLFEDECLLHQYNCEQLLPGEIRFMKTDAGHCLRLCQMIQCQDNYAPICASVRGSGLMETLNNECELNRRLCLSQTRWFMLYEGPCVSEEVLVSNKKWNPISNQLFKPPFANLSSPANKSFSNPLNISEADIISFLSSISKLLPVAPPTSAPAPLVSAPSASVPSPSAPSASAPSSSTPAAFVSPQVRTPSTDSHIAESSTGVPLPCKKIMDKIRNIWMPTGKCFESSRELSKTSSNATETEENTTTVTPDTPNEAPCPIDEFLTKFMFEIMQILNSKPFSNSDTTESSGDSVITTPDPRNPT